MIHRFPTGTKEQNDLLVLPQGAITIDGVNSLRVHNGEQSGGGVLELERVVPPPPPGFHGEVPASQLINGPDLAALVGLTAGSSQNSNEPWLKFVDPIDFKTKYISKKPYRHTISWNQLNAAGIVYGKEVTIGSNQYICRLIKSGHTDPMNGNLGYDTEPTWGSEWNRLMYPICAPTGNPEYDIINDPSSSGLGAWAQYNQEDDLILLYTGGYGSYQWCQETHSVSTLQRALRGYIGVSWVQPDASSLARSNYGWRPCLELIE